MKEMNHTNDLIAGFSRGTLQSIHQLHTMHFTSLLYFAEGIIRDRPMAGEIVLETFIKLVNRRQYFENLPDIKAFLYITTRNVCMDYLRFAKNGHAAPGPVLVKEETEIDMADESVITEACRVLWSAVEGMPALYRQIFRLLFIEGMQTAAAYRQLEIEARELLVCRKRLLHELQKALSEQQLYSTPLLVHFLTIACRKHLTASKIPVPVNR